MSFPPYPWCYPTAQHVVAGTSIALTVPYPAWTGVNTLGTGSSSTRENSKSGSEVVKGTADFKGSLSTFTGAEGEDIDNWIGDFTHLMRVNKWQDRPAAEHLRLFLRGAALQWWRSLDGEVVKSWNATSALLRQEFAPARPHQHALSKLTVMKQAGQDIGSFSRKILELFRKAEITDNVSKLRRGSHKREPNAELVGRGRAQFFSATLNNSARLE